MEKFEIFFNGLLHISWLGWEVKNDMSGQSKEALRVCNVKIRKSLTGAEMGHIFVTFLVSGP